MRHLHRIKDGKKKHIGQLATITYETLRHLENGPSKHQSQESVKGCLKALEEFNLNKTEKLMIVNNPPTTALEIQLVHE